MSFPLDHILSESTRSPFLQVIGSVLESVVRSSPADAGETFFDAPRPPTVPLFDYIKRWVRYTRCGMVTVVGAMVLMDRACMMHNMSVTGLSVHRLLLASLTLAHKWCVDIPFLNSHYAQVGGVPLPELNSIECHLLTLLEFDVTVSAEQLDTYVKMFRGHKDWPEEEDRSSSPGCIVEKPLRSLEGSHNSKRTSLTRRDSQYTENGLSDSRKSMASLPPAPKSASGRRLRSKRESRRESWMSDSARFPVIETNQV
eukprot:Hpha_TRINITY_DN15176_c0_g6::TRINITY_DN15176_c0_g6_i1::g.127747::m.127747